MIIFKKILKISIISFIVGFLFVFVLFTQIFPNSIFSFAIPYIFILPYIFISEKGDKFNLRSFFMSLIYTVISMIAYIIGLAAVLVSFSGFTMM